MALNYLKHHSKNDPNSVKAVVYILGLVFSPDIDHKRRR